MVENSVWDRPSGRHVLRYLRSQRPWIPIWAGSSGRIENWKHTEIPTALFSFPKNSAGIPGDNILIAELWLENGFRLVHFSRNAKGKRKNGERIDRKIAERGEDLASTTAT